MAIKATELQTYKKYILKATKMRLFKRVDMDGIKLRRTYARMNRKPAVRKDA
jgi:hypothetical protein